MKNQWRSKSIIGSEAWPYEEGNKIARGKTMQVKFEENQLCALSDIDVAEVFIYEKQSWFKTTDSPENDNKWTAYKYVLCINLESGDPRAFKIDTEVRPADSHLSVSPKLVEE